jgi:hypothetical protein
MDLDWDIDAAKYLTDQELKIPDSHRVRVCKYKAGNGACRYIALTAKLGFLCVKNTPLKTYIDLEATSNPKGLAKGNNCDGFGEYGKQKKDGQKLEASEKSEESNKKDNPPTTQDNGSPD